jgi:hypothetical protein
MTLYSANLENLATPVNSTTPAVKPVKGRKKKTVEISETPTAPPPTPETSPATTPTPKEKKPLTEKQKAAVAKMQETRKRKREEKEKEQAEAAEKTAIAEKEKEILEKQKELKKAEQAEKRKKRRLEKKEGKSDTISEAVDDAVTSLATAAVKTPKSDEPPKWFKKYIEGVAVEQNSLKKDKRPKTEIKREASEAASKSWQDGHTRDRVQTEVDAHMDRMYEMMFSRKLK